MKKVLITGGAGYIGSVLVHNLASQNKHDVTVVDNGLFGFYSIQNLQNINLLKKNIRHISISDLDGVECVVHLGGFSNDPQAEFCPIGNEIVNRDYTEDLVKKCVEANVKRFVFASSAAIYGFVDSGKIMNEDCPVNPQSYYARSKLEAEEILKKHDIELIILRKGTVCGLSYRMRYDLVINTICKSIAENCCVNLFGGGEVWRPLLDVNDAANIYAEMIDIPYEKIDKENPVYNVAHSNYRISELGLRIKDIFERIEPDLRGKIHVNCDYQIKENRSYSVDSSKLKNIGINYSVNLFQTVQNIVESFRSDRFTDFDNPIYYNIKWIKHMIQMSEFFPMDENRYSEFTLGE